MVTAWSSSLNMSTFSISMKNVVLRQEQMVEIIELSKC